MLSTPHHRKTTRAEKLYYETKDKIQKSNVVLGYNKIWVLEAKHRKILSSDEIPEGKPNQLCPQKGLETLLLFNNKERIGYKSMLKCIMDTLEMC